MGRDRGGDWHGTNGVGGRAATSKANGKWRSDMFPGREFDDLDEYRAAKKQRAARREEYSAQNGLRGSRGGARDIE